MNQYVMSRESRILLNNLSELASQHNISKLVVPSEIMMADFLCLKFYTNPALNIIKQNIKKKRKFQSKHFTPDYYLQILNNYAANNPSITRDYAVGLPPNVDIFKLISGYLMVDYSIKDAYKIYKLCTQHTLAIVQSAVRTAIQMKVHNLQYIQTIIDSKNAEAEMKKRDIQSIIDREDQFNAVNTNKIVYEDDDIKNIQNNWNDAIRDADIEKMFKDIYGE